MPAPMLASSLDAAVRGAASYRLRMALLDRRPDDQFIAAFPRSGSTWLRTMLTDVMVPGADGNPSVFNAAIPGIKLRRMGALRASAGPRLMMTHSPWLPALRRVVYVVRDGHAAVVSFYHYLITRQGKSLPFDVFFERYLRGAYGVPWHTHIDGWLGRGAARLGDDLLVVRFEDMRADTEAVLGQVVRFLGLDADAGALRHAAERATLGNARRIEATRRGPLASADASFYRSGATVNDGSPLAGALAERFDRASAAALALAGYPVSGR